MEPTQSCRKTCLNLGAMGLGAGSRTGLTGRSRRTAGVAVALTASLALFVIAAVSSAGTGGGPTISGDPEVGEVLTASDVDDTGLYKWQRCSPDAADCAAATQFDAAEWADIPNAHGQEFRAYTLTDADLGRLVRVIAKGTSMGEKWVASNAVGPVGGVAPPPPPDPDEPPAVTAQSAPQAIAPQHGVQLIGEPVSGETEVKVPGQKGFVPLTQLREIPVGSVIDTRGSRMRLTAATGNFGNTTPDQSVEFWAGLFRITQPATANSDATARLVEKLSCNGGGNGEAAKASSGGPIAVAAGRRKRKMWGSGTGSYATAGSGGTGSVRGTTWLTKDGCDGTLFKVTQGIGIDVKVKGLKKLIALGPGEKYFAED